MPLLNRRIGRRRVWPRCVPSRDVFEVRVEPLRGRQPAEWWRIEAQDAPQQTTRAACVNHKGRDDADWLPATRAFQRRSIAIDRHAIDRGFVEVDRAGGLSLAHEIVIEVRPVPMGVADVIVRAGGDHQLALVSGIGVEWLTLPMKE